MAKKQNKIYVVGVGGSGKNWLSERLSEKLDIPCYDLDDIAWVKKYTIKRDKKKRALMVGKLVLKKKWIICGVGKSYIGNLADKADLIIILRISLMRSTYRIFRRYLVRKFKGEPEALRTLIKAYRWGLKDHHRKDGVFYKYLNGLEEEYSGKVLVLDKRGVKGFLKKV